jgi:peptidoglycan/LPS O-acetylase OafA/YrhL
MIGQKSIPYLNQTGRFGDISYGIYIYAFPVQQVVVWQLQHKVDWWLLLATATLITIILALSSWHFIEKWALKLKPQTPINDM